MDKKYNSKNQQASKISFEHCLRPGFTELIYSELRLKRKSINLIGANGHGKSRLIDDLIQCKLPPNTKILRINLSEFRNNFVGFENSINNQLGFSLEVKENFDKSIELFLEKNKELYILFFLDSFDSICETKDKDILFDRKFLAVLNALKNGDRVSLLCVTQKSVKSIILYIQEIKEIDGKKKIEEFAFDSPLDIDVKEISKLSELEIELELNRSPKKLKEYLMKFPEVKKELIVFIQNYTFCYTLLEYCKDKLSFELVLFEKDKEKWLSESVASLELKYKPSLDKRIRNLDSKATRLKDRTIRIIKILFTIQKAATIWGRILQWVIRIGIPLIILFYKKILLFIEILLQ